MNDIQKIDADGAIPIVAAPQSESAQLMAIIARAAENPDIDVSKMSALLDLKERMMTKQAEVEANQAFCRVCKAMPAIIKKGAIDFGKGQKPIPYAKWEDVQAVIRPIYEAEGFTLSFDADPREGGGVIYTAILMHENGFVRKSSIPLPLDTSGGKQNIQGMGSTASYGQRYTTKQLFNLVFEGEDDDGKKGGMTFIEVADQCQINALIEQTKTNLPKFLQTFEIAAVENIQKKDLPRVLNALNTKKANMAKVAKQ